jgi:starvation-inducible outer membrane lipoprotein
MKILTICLSLMISACSTISYKDQTSEFSKTSFGTMTNVQEIHAQDDGHGGRVITLTGYSSDQVQALRAVTEAAVSAAIKGMKP